MRKILTLLLLLTSISTLSCGSGGAGPANVPPGENPGIASVIRLLAAQYIAQVNASIYLRAKVLDGNGLAVPNKTVTFSILPPATIGTLSSPSVATRADSSTSFTAVTDSNGIASAKLDSGTSGFVTIQAAMDSAASQIIAKNTVYFSTYPLTYPTSSTTASTLRLDVDANANEIYNEQADYWLFKSSGDNQAKIRATILDSSNMPVANTTVTFGSDSTSATFSQGTKTTDKNGQASTIVTVASSIITQYTTTLNITASVANGAANMTTLFLNPVAIDINKSSLTANPTNITLNGTSAISAVVKLTTGAYAPDATTVNFTADCGTVTPFAQTTTGVAAATFTAPATPALCSITATVGSITVGTVAITTADPLTVQSNTKTVSGLTGGIATFTIFGGMPSYTINSSDVKFPASVSTVSSSGGTFSVTVPANSANTTVTYTVRDAAGVTVTTTLTIGTPALSVSPASQTILDSGQAQFTVADGAPPYQITTSDTSLNPSPSTVSSSGGTFTVSVPYGTKAKTVTYTVIDSVGTVATSTLIVTITPATPPPPVSALVISPSAVTVSKAPSPVITFVISGGSGSYSATSSDVACAYNTVGVNTWTGSTINVTIPATCTQTSATINVSDSAANAVVAAITIGP